MEGLLAVHNQTTHGLPVLNGPEGVSNVVLYPEMGISKLPCTFLGATQSHRETLFIFASGAIPAQKHYEEIKTNEVSVSQVVAIGAGAANILDLREDERVTFRHRRAYANQAVDVALQMMRHVFGTHRRDAMRACQIICIGRLYQPVDNLIWMSIPLDLGGKSRNGMRRLLIPFCMGDEMDNYTALEGSDQDPEHEDQTYQGFILRVFHGRAAVQLNAHCFDFGTVFRAFFFNDDGSTAWVVKTNNEHDIAAYNRAFDGVLLIDQADQTAPSLYSFTHTLTKYLTQHGRNWADFWPRSPFSPRFRLSAQVWRDHFSVSPIVNAIITHVKAKRPINAEFSNNLEELDRLMSARGGGSNMRRLSSHAIFVNMRLVESLGRMTPPQLAYGAVLPITAWSHILHPFENQEAYNAFVRREHPSLTDSPTNAQTISWPLWFFIIQFRPNVYTNFNRYEFVHRANRVLAFLRRHADVVIQSDGAIKALLAYRRQWVRAELGLGRWSESRALSSLDSVLIHLYEL